MQRTRENLRHRGAQPHCCFIEDEYTLVVNVEHIVFDLENVALSMSKAILSTSKNDVFLALKKSSVFRLKAELVIESFFRKTS